MAPKKQPSGINVQTRKPYATLGKRQQSAVRKKYRVANKTFEKLNNLQQMIQQGRTQRETANLESRQPESPRRPDVDHLPVYEPPFPESREEIVRNNCEQTPANNRTAMNPAPQADEQDWNDLSFADKLAHTFLTTAMNHTQSSSVLRVLRTHPCHHNLPIDSRTLLKTPRKRVEVKMVAPGEYLHIGLEVALVRILRFAVDPIPDEIELDLHADGAELYKKISIWPLQFRCPYLPSVSKFIGIIGIYRGRHQPNSAHDFFESLVDEFQKIKDNGGILFCEKRIQIKFRFFIGDAKARAFILNHKSCTATKACSKCHVRHTLFVSQRKGKSYHTYCGVKHKKRTDASYILRRDKDHHHPNSSPLESLGIGLVSQVPFDYMHLVLIGEVKKLLSAWIDSEHAEYAAFSDEQLEIAANNFLEISKCVPVEFARKPSILTDYKAFKATEFRQILLFSGPIIFHGVMKENIFIHFLLLHAAIRCLVYYAKSEFHLRFADIALNKFVGGCEGIYSRSVMTYNTHGHLHLVEDVRKCEEDLESFSAFPYESNMTKFRKLCRSPNKPLQQIAKRLAEEAHKIKITETKTPATYAYHLRHRNDETGTKHYDSIKTPEFKLSTRSPNNCVKVNDNICIISDIIHTNDQYFVKLRKYETKEEFYNVGISSIDVGIYLCCSLQAEFETVSIDEISKKCFHALLPRSDINYSVCDSVSADNDQYVIVQM